MSDNKNILTHIATDKNAKYHLIIGTIASGSLWVLSNDITAPFWIGILVGVFIEAWQRWHGGHNSYRESYMDALTTAIPGMIMSIVSFISLLLEVV
ncbi:MAG: hypothetical protein D6732_08140 [Methanobacteriota archaeon]|nr:MAG: hypothetical protein D6732_08140 [Euryarchaeota archaeon]